jgi:hypothetical protein
MNVHTMARPSLAYAAMTGEDIRSGIGRPPRQPHCMTIETLDAKEPLTPYAAITVPATGLRPQARRRRGSPTARVTPQKDGRFKSVVMSLCRFV